jgi:hypothetical protein
MTKPRTLIAANQPQIYLKVDRVKVRSMRVDRGQVFSEAESGERERHWPPGRWWPPAADEG